jgi:hypothetical protein
LELLLLVLLTVGPHNGSSALQVLHVSNVTSTTGQEVEHTLLHNGRRLHHAVIAACYVQMHQRNNKPRKSVP